MSEGTGNNPEAPRSFLPANEPQRGPVKQFVRRFTGKEAREDRADLKDISDYAGMVRRLDENTLRLSTSAGGGRAEQNLIAGACRLAFETGHTVSLRSPEGTVDAISPEVAKKVLTEVAMTIPEEMRGDHVGEDGQPTERTLKYCAATIVASLTHGDDDARFYDSVMVGKDLRTRFANLQAELSQKE